MNIEISLEEKLEILKRMFLSEKEEAVCNTILKEIREIEECIHARDELERKINN